MADVVVSCACRITALASFATLNSQTKPLLFPFFLKCVSSVPTESEGIFVSSEPPHAPEPPNAFEGLLHSSLPIVFGVLVGVVVSLMARKYGQPRVSGLMMATCAYVGINISEDTTTTPAVF